VNTNDVSDTQFTYLIPKNILKKFILISDINVEICGFMFGTNPKNNPNVK